MSSLLTNKKEKELCMCGAIVINTIYLIFFIRELTFFSRIISHMSLVIKLLIMHLDLINDSGINILICREKEYYWIK